jgi:hypothetical protein
MTSDPGSSVTNPWFTTHPEDLGICGPTSPTDRCHPLEVWGNGFNAVPSFEGVNFVELNASTSSFLYQNICMTSGDTIAYSFAHRGRLGVENTSFVVRSQSGALIQNIRAVSTGPSAWSVYSDSAAYSGVSGVQRFGFETSDPGGVGNFLDAIDISLRPLIDIFGTNGAVGLEGSTIGSVRLRINGRVVPGTVVGLQILGTANDADAVLAGVSNAYGPVTVAHVAGTGVYLIGVPPGDYDGGVVAGFGGFNDPDGVSLTLSAVADGVAETTEGLTFQVLAPGVSGASTNWATGDTICVGDAVLMSPGFTILAPTTVTSPSPGAATSGSPAAYAARPPRIRTCGFPASGSSCSGLAHDIRVG